MCGSASTRRRSTRTSSPTWTSRSTSRLEEDAEVAGEGAVDPQRMALRKLHPGRADVDWLLGRYDGRDASDSLQILDERIESPPVQAVDQRPPSRFRPTP